MKTGTAVIWGLSLVVMAGLGFVVGISLGQTPDEAVRVDPGVERADGSSAPDSNEAAAGSVRAADTPARVERSPRATTTEYDSSVPPRGSGVVLGRCEDVDGTPIEGVEVRLIPNARGQFPAPPPGADVEERIAHMAATMRWTERATVRALSGADGTVRFEGLADAGYRLAVQWKHHWPASQHREELRPGAEFVAKGRRAARLYFDVTDGDGAPVERGTVRIGTRMSVAWNSQPEGALVTPGTHDITLTAGDATVSWEDVELSLDEPVRLSGELEARGGIRATVSVEGGGTPSQHLQVRATRLADGVEPDPTLLDVRGSVQAIRTQDGHQRLFPLAPGRWLVGAREGRRGEYEATSTVEVAASIVELELVLPTPEEAEVLAVTVLGADEEVIRDAQVWLTARIDRRVVRSEGQVRTDEHGARLVAWPVVAPDADAVFSLEVAHAEWGRMRTTVDRRVPTRTVRFAAAANPKVQIAGYVGSPAQGRLLVSAERVAGQGRIHGGDAMPDEEGVCVLPAIQPGRIRVFINVQLGPRARSPVAYQEFDVSPGDATLTVSLPALHSTTLVLGEAAVGNRIRVWRPPSDRNDPLHVRADAVVTKDGELALKFLPAGQYHVRGRGLDADTVVTLPGPERVDLRRSR